LAAIHAGSKGASSRRELHSVTDFSARSNGETDPSLVGLVVLLEGESVMSRRLVLGTLALAGYAVLAALVVFLGWMLVRMDARLSALENKPLTNLSLIEVHYQSSDGADVSAPETMPVWQYVEAQRGGKDMALRWAIESDLHNGDPTFHLTHEEIDGKTWDDAGSKNGVRLIRAGPTASPGW